MRPTQQPDVVFYLPVTVEEAPLLGCALTRAEVVQRQLILRLHEMNHENEKDALLREMNRELSTTEDAKRRLRQQVRLFESQAYLRLLERGKLSAQKALDNARAEECSEETAQLLRDEIEAADRCILRVNR